MEFDESESMINDADDGGGSEIPNAFLDNLMDEIELESVEGGDGGLEIADLPDFEENLKSEDGADGKRVDRSAVLEKNYPRLFLPTYINDILANFGTDLCLMEGESLLLFALSREDIDWTRGGEPLHLFYCVEQLLGRLKERGANIEIVFFKNGRSLWPQELYKFRQLLIHHLKRHSPFPVFSGSNGFDSWCSPAFLSHFDEEKPTFCVFFDPTELPPSFRGGAEEKSDNQKRGLERFSSKKDVSSQYLVPSIVSCICEFQTPVVLFPIDFGVNTVEAFVVTYEVTVKNRTKKIIDEIVREILGTTAGEQKALEKEKAKKTFLESVSALNFAFKYGERMILSCLSLKSLLPSLSNEEKELAKLYIVHLFFLEHLALRHRAFPLIPPEVSATLKKNNKYLPLLPDFCKKVLETPFTEGLDLYLEDAEPLEDSILINNSCDLYSGGLLDALCRAICKEGDSGVRDAKKIGLSDSICEEFSKVWSWVAGSAPLYPLLPASGQTTEEGEILSQMIHKQSPPHAVAPIQVALFEDFLSLTKELTNQAAGESADKKEIKDAESTKTEAKTEEEDQLDSWEDLEEDSIVIPQKAEPKPVQEAEAVTEQASEPEVQEAADKPFSDVYQWHSGKEFFVNDELFLSSFETRMMVRVRERMRGVKLTKADYPTKLSDLSPPERALLDKVRLKNKQKLGRFEQRYIESLEGYTMNLQKMIIQKQPVAQPAAPTAAAGKKKAEKKEKEPAQKVSAASQRLKEENALAQEEKARKSAEDKAVQIKEMATDVFALQKFISNPNTPTFTVLLLLIEKLRLCQIRVENGTATTQDYIVMVEALQKIYTDFFRASGENKKHIGYIKEAWVKGLCVVARNLGFTKAADYFEQTWKEDLASVSAPKAEPKKAGAKGAKGGKDKGKAAAKGKAKGKAKAGAAKGGKKEEDSEESEGSDWEEGPTNAEKEKKKEPEVSPDTVNKYFKMTPIRFQLKFMSHILLRRDAPAERDDRVKFAPDPWQKELLNIVDKKESALICAPTSSGKTFACFYAMEQVLTEDDDGVVVYVAPTKALVNQTVADTEARLRKYYSHGGRVMSGYFTKDYRKDILNCQVLITVPACLEVLLLSPTHFEWRQRLRYIVFDEFHCIDSITDGGIWERLFQMISCPFLALSATVGNPQAIQGWLERLQTRPVHLIMYGERYSDLKKWDFLPTTTSATCWDNVVAENLTVHPEFKPKGTQHLFSSESLIPLHPASLLASLPSVAFPADMRLSAEECMILYDVMAEVAGKSWADTTKLKPERFFAECRFVSRRDARQYEEELKNELLSWDQKKKESVHKMLSGPASSDSDATVLDPHKVFVLLGKELQEARKKQEAELPDTTSPTSFQFVRDNILNLLLVLSEKEMLPCIVFCYDRAMCEKLASKLLEQLERKQNEKDERRYAEIRKHWTEYERKKKKEKRSRDEDEKKKNIVNKEDGFKEVLKAETGVGDPEIVMPQEIDPDFTFLNPGSTIDIPESLVQIAAADAAGMGIKFMDLIKRGIGIHHSGLPKKSRQVVEMLFRQKYLRVVIATGTLSLGINMPCRSVVFATDSLYINPLEFRQASGRAGRRGFDDLGNVVFCGFTPGRISHLMTAPVPIIRGKFSLSTTEVLRLLMQYNTLTSGAAKGDQKELQLATLQAAKRVISHPLLAISLKEESAEFNSVFLEFALQVLYRCRLIDNKGAPVNFAGLVSHLYYFEPSNLAFSWLIQHGYFAKYAKSVKKGVSPTADLEIYKQLLLVVANIFNRRFVHKVALARLAADNWRSPSKVVLEKMHPIFQEGLKDYNNTLKQLAFTFLSKFAEKKLGSIPDNTLPLTSDHAVKFRWEDNKEAFGTDPNSIAGKLLDNCLVYHCRSAFGALSGKGDQWDSLGDLANSLRSGIPFIVSSLPIFEQQNERSLNRFIIDFWSHGQVSPLSKANGMRLGDVWNEVNESHKLLQSISNALDKLQETAPQMIQRFTASCFKDIEAEFNEKFRTAFQMK